MTYQQVNDMIASFGLPYAYYEFPDDTPQVPPFVCFYYEQTDDVYADDKNYQRIIELTIEFYSKHKDFVIETNIEQTLTAAGLTYVRYGQFLDSEHMHETVYEMEVLITQ